MKILSYIYLLITRMRNFLYNKKIIKPFKSKSFVISIGNLIAGGTGKTPIILYLASYLQSLGFKVGIIAGGYRRKSKGLLVVHNVDKLLTDVEKAGDEAFLLAKSVTCPLLIHDKKYLALKEMDRLFDNDIVLIDDGFQHRKISRDLDIVIINDKTINEENLIPAGYLREETKNLERADTVLYRDLNETIKLFENKDSFHFSSKIRLDQIRRNRAIILTAIANPSNFVNFLIENDATIEKVFSFEDHHFFIASEIDEIIHYCSCNSIKFVYTTEKDYVKLEKYEATFEKTNIVLLVIKLEILFDNDLEFKNYINLKINEKINTI